MTDFAAAAINLPGQARRLNAFGAIDLRLSAADTAGRMGVIETIAQPLEGPPLHVHTREDENVLRIGWHLPVHLRRRAVHRRRRR